VVDKCPNYKIKGVP